MRVTLKTLAADLGVSAATVSNAYNRPDQLSDALRGRILARAAELGYDGPDPAGAALRSGHAGALGLLLSYRLHYAFSDPFAVSFLAGFSEACEESGTGLLLLPMALDDQEAGLAALRHANVDGLTDICLLRVEEVHDLARRRGVPFVGTYPREGGDWVVIDDRGAGALLGDHLAGLGHADLVVVVDSERAPDSPVRTLADLAPGDPWDAAGLDSMWCARVRGVREAAPGARVRVVQTGYNSPESGRAAAAYAWGWQRRPTAIACVSDVLALGAIDELAERGARVPQDVSVCGIDDIPAAGAAGLTTVRQPIREKGARVARLLLDPDLQPRQVTLPIALVVRGTTGPPA